MRDGYFKAGDFIQCIDPGISLEKGKIYEVSSIKYNENLRLVGFGEMGFLPRRFGPIQGMSSEYDEIIQAQEIYENLEGGS